jgi:Na+-translocating ferredoxin:NAD+ oxidoreductase RnfD subunit
VKLRLPRDGRYYIFTNHILLITLGFVVFNFQRTLLQLVIGLAAAFGTEIVCTKLSQKNVGKGLWDRLLSASIAALSLFLLIDSPNLWFYGYGGVVAIISKYLLRLDLKRHAINPTNVAIIVLLAALPPYNFRLYADEFSLYPFPILQALFFGILATTRSDRWMVGLAYMVTIFAGGAVMNLVTSRGLLFYIGPEISASGLTYIWLMITDPRTTPAARRDQAVFAASVALVNLALKEGEVIYSQFIALFAVSGARAALTAFDFASKKPQAAAQSLRPEPVAAASS